MHLLRKEMTKINGMPLARNGPIKYRAAKTAKDLRIKRNRLTLGINLESIPYYLEVYCKPRCAGTQPSGSDAHPTIASSTHFTLATINSNLQHTCIF